MQGCTIEALERARALNDYFQLSVDDIAKAKKLCDDIKADKSVNTKKKGDLLEELVMILFSNAELFSISQNERTSTNEIDIVISLSIIGKSLRSEKIIDRWFPSDFIIECKNYSDKVDVTYIGKFFSLLQTSNRPFGIFVSTKGISGQSDKKLQWKDASGFIKKAHLIYSNPCNDPFYIIPINIEDIIQSLNYNKGNVLALIKDIKNCIDLDIANDFNSNIIPHDNEAKIVSSTSNS